MTFGYWSADGFYAGFRKLLSVPTVRSFLRFFPSATGYSLVSRNPGDFSWYLSRRVLFLLRRNVSRHERSIFSRFPRGLSMAPPHGICRSILRKISRNQLSALAALVSFHRRPVFPCFWFSALDQPPGRSGLRTDGCLFLVSHCRKARPAIPGFLVRSDNCVRPLYPPLRARHHARSPVSRDMPGHHLFLAQISGTRAPSRPRGHRWFRDDRVCC